MKAQELNLLNTNAYSRDIALACRCIYAKRGRKLCMYEWVRAANICTLSVSLLWAGSCLLMHSWPVFSLLSSRLLFLDEAPAEKKKSLCSFNFQQRKPFMVFFPPLSSFPSDYGRQKFSLEIKFRWQTARAGNISGNHAPFPSSTGLKMHFHSVMEDLC